MPPLTPAGPEGGDQRGQHERQADAGAEELDIPPASAAPEPQQHPDLPPAACFSSQSSAPPGAAPPISLLAYTAPAWTLSHIPPNSPPFEVEVRSLSRSVREIAVGGEGPAGKGAHLSAAPASRGTPPGSGAAGRPRRWGDRRRQIRAPCLRRRPRIRPQAWPSSGRPASRSISRPPPRSCRSCPRRPTTRGAARGRRASPARR